jgi:cellulose synthase operon protein YhjU
MSYWSPYFLIKTGLFYTHYIGFNWGLNLLLALFIAWPVAAGRWQRARGWVVWPAALALLYHDSFLPTPARVLSQLGALGGFSGEYILELLGRVINPPALAAFVALLVLHLLLARWLRLSTFAFMGILSVPLLTGLNSTPGASAGSAPSISGLTAVSPEVELKAFYAAERQRRLVFPKTVSPPPFDVIVLHVCSLSWDDLDFVQERNAPLLKRFDVLFSNFNSAASYSGPASLRVLHGNCGQYPHDALYKAADPQCYTFPALERAGYQVNALLNHNGIFDSFSKILEVEGGLVGKLQPNTHVPAQMQGFDGSPIYDDVALLSGWWTKRQTQGAAPVALYYNSISLHDGNRVAGQSARNSLVTYKPRLTKLMADFDRFISQLEASGKPVVVMLVPEHGASLRGDKVQISGMREIPDPKITLVPAAIKLVGMKSAASGPLMVNKPVSYFGLYSLLGDMMANNPYAPGSKPLAERLDAIPTTPFVAENADVVVMRNQANAYLMKSSDGTWLPYQN